MTSTFSVPAATTAHRPDAVELRGLTREYGRVPALRWLDLRLPRGCVCALVGPAGAGKSTLLGILAGLVHPSWGEARVFGLDATREAAALRRRVGFMRQEPRFPFWMTGREALQLAGRFIACGGADLDERIAARLDQAGLAEIADARTGSYREAERLRLCLAQALLGDPELLLLDAPFAGLDAAGRAELATLIARLRGRSTVLISARTLEEVAPIADIAVVLHQGRATYIGPVRGCRSVGEALRRRS